ncbi:MAG: hypothetical protein HN337_05025 [Deltaproteobacteria bacterium]|nr:hypothetical protein [Deltaproteobacteria bacterium]
MISAGNLAALATEGLTLGVAGRPFTVGAAATTYVANPRVTAMFELSGPQLSSIPGRAGDVSAFTGVTPRAPQGVSDFVKMYASPDGMGGVHDFVGPDTFEALQNAWDEGALATDKQRLVHSFWVYSSLMQLQLKTHEALGRFEGANPGRGVGTNLHNLARATHEAWLTGEKQQKYYTPYTQEVHDFIRRCITGGLITSVDLETHHAPGKKFKLMEGDFVLPDDAEATVAFSRSFEAAAGRAFESGFMLNTVGGEWKALLGIQVQENPDWMAERPAYLFKLQTDNVAAVLFGLENEAILKSLGEGSAADKAQSLIEMLRIINVAWRVNNPWGGLNSPLIAKPFALEEDGGIGIGDILRDAVTLRSALITLEAARVKSRVKLPAYMGDGLHSAFSRGLIQALDIVTDEEALAVAVKANTKMYGIVNPLAEPSF